MVYVEIILAIQKVKLQMYYLENASQIYSEVKKENNIKIDTEVTHAGEEETEISGAQWGDEFFFSFVCLQWS